MCVIRELIAKRKIVGLCDFVFFKQRDGLEIIKPVCV